jgi:hypothetical protein
MIDEDDCGAIGGMKIGRGNQSTLRKPAPAPLCPPQIPHDQTQAWTPDRRAGKPAINRLSYGVALLFTLMYGSVHTDQQPADSKFYMQLLGRLIVSSLSNLYMCSYLEHDNNNSLMAVTFVLDAGV